MDEGMHTSSSGLVAASLRSPSRGSVGGVHYEDEDEGDVCRICRSPGEAENPLRYPCACSGSIKYVHEDCLLQWLNHSGALQCEVCKHAFSFSSVYAKNAPARLPFQEFVFGMTVKACHVLQSFLRLALVLSVWLLITPFVTFWIWRLSFVRGLHEAYRLFLNHMSPSLMLIDCLHGLLLCTSIGFIFLGVAYLGGYSIHIGQLEGHVDDEGQQRHGAHAVRRLPGAANRLPDGDGNAEGGGVQGMAGVGFVRRNAENVAAWIEMQAARLEAHVELMFDALVDVDGADDIPLDQFVGMQGPVFDLIKNATTILAINGIFLAVSIYIPFSLGRVIIYYIIWFFSSASGPMLAKVVPLTEPVFSLTNIISNSALTAVNNLSVGQNEGILGQVLEVVTDSLKINATRVEVSKSVSVSIIADVVKRAVVGNSHLSDVTTLAVGYMFIFSVVFFYLGLLVLTRYIRGGCWSLGRLSGLVTIAEVISSLFKQLLAEMRHLMAMVKVAFLLVIELGIFPFICGWWLDICTLRMLGLTLDKRIDFFSVSPFASSSVHWLVGIAFMVQINIFVGLLRGVLRPGVLYFFRDPYDPNDIPFSDLIDHPVYGHARRLLLCVAVYGSSIAMLIFLPVKLAMHLAPSMFPLDITIFDPFTEIPAGMLLFQICIPFAIEHFKPHATIQALLWHWFAAVGWALGLTDFLLLPPDENGSQDAGNAAPERGNRLHDALQDVVRQNGQPLIPLIGVEDHANREDVIGTTDITEEYDLDDQADYEYGFILRIILLLVLAWITLLLFNSALIVLPISLGRALFNSIPRLPITHGFKCNDLFAFSIGCYVIWAAVAGARYTIDYIRIRRANVLISHIWKWCSIVLKSSALLSIWVFVIPVLIGLLIELLAIVPMRVPVDESPVFLLYQDWALGLIVLEIWSRLVMLEQMQPLLGESWRRKFERVREDGFSRLRGLWVLQEIVIPIISKLLTALCLPYVFAKGIFPVFGYPLIVNSAVYRFAWLGCLLFSLLYFCIKWFQVWITNLHNSIRDDRYRTGRRLDNYGEIIT